MAGLLAMQRQFAASLAVSAMPVPEFLKCASAAVAHRLCVYRNNAVIGLAHILSSRFPAVETIVGDEFFAGLARQFMEQHPPCSPALIEYGANFPAYIRTLLECADVPYLADVADIEWQLHRCAHAADEPPLRLDDLADLKASPDALTFHFMPSSGLVFSGYPAHTIWRANTGPAPEPLVLPRAAEATLITRRALRCEAVLLPPGGYEFAAALAAGRTLAEAAALAAMQIPSFELDQSLGLMLRQDAFSRNFSISAEGVHS